MINSRSHLVSETSNRFTRKGLHRQRRTFSRSYGTILPSSFTRVLSSAWVYSTCLPVSVCGTVCVYLMLRGFSWQPGFNDFVDRSLTLITPHLNMLPDFPKNTGYALVPTLPTVGSSSLLRHPIAINTSTGILTCCPSTTLFSLALGTDSPCSDERRAGNLRLSAKGTCTPFIVTHVSIRTSDTSSTLLNAPSTAYRTLLYRLNISKNVETRRFGRCFKSRYIFRAGRLDQ